MRSSLIAFLSATFLACGQPAGSRKAPDFALLDMDGRLVRLSSFIGRPVLINFWATWCDSCREEMPALEALHRRRPGLVLLGVSIDEDAARVVPPFARAHGLTYPLLADAGTASAAYAVRGLPTSFLIDADGLIARRWVGPLDARAVENDILALSSRRPP